MNKVKVQKGYIQHADKKQQIFLRDFFVKWYCWFSLNCIAWGDLYTMVNGEKKWKDDFYLIFPYTCSFNKVRCRVRSEEIHENSYDEPQVWRLCFSFNYYYFFIRITVRNQCKINFGKLLELFCVIITSSWISLSGLLVDCFISKTSFPVYQQILYLSKIFKQSFRVSSFIKWCEKI